MTVLETQTAEEKSYDKASLLAKLSGGAIIESYTAAGFGRAAFELLQAEMDEYPDSQAWSDYSSAESFMDLIGNHYNIAKAIAERPWVLQMAYQRYLCELAPWLLLEQDAWEVAVYVLSHPASAVSLEMMPGTTEREEVLAEMTLEAFDNLTNCDRLSSLDTSNQDLHRSRVLQLTARLLRRYIRHDGAVRLFPTT